MSQLILDDQLDISEVFFPIRKWITARRLQELRPGELIRDERVPEILRTLKSPTFITIDHGFWNARLCHPDYCIVYSPCATTSNNSSQACYGHYSAE
jgi:hypothetical protein